MPLVGSAIGTTPPTATHRCASGQEMPVRLAAPSTPLTIHVPAPPVGLLDVTTSPYWSTATHSDGSAHETPVSSVPGSTDATVHSAPGLVDVTTSPLLSTATHSVASG